MSSTRSEKDVFDLLEHITSDTSGFYKCAQLVKFGENATDEDTFLLEITPALADQLLASGDFEAEIKSEDGPHSDDAAYLCTEKGTQRVLENETSDSLLIVPDLRVPSKPLSEFWSENKKGVSTCTVSSVQGMFLVLSTVRAPSLRRLKERLLPTDFAGHVEDEEQDEKAFENFPTFEELKASLACSERELLFALDRLNIYLWKHQCRMFRLEYLSSVLQAIFDMADELSIEWCKTGFRDPDEVVKRLESLYPSCVVRQVFQRFFYRRRGSGDSGVYPRVGKICAVIGENLLSITKKFGLSDFVAVWCGAVPHGMQPRLHRHLSNVGRAYCDVSKATREEVITYLASEDLPDDSVESRLTALFDRRSVWPEAELAGYMADVVVVGETLGDPELLPLHSNVEKDLVILSDSEDDDGGEVLGNCEEVEEEPEKLALDKPLPVAARIGAVLNQHCRVSVVPGTGRCYTEKYPRR